MHNFTNYSSTFLSLSAARYYNSDLSIWISVDPLVDKYPNLSPYTYCANNPVGLVDANGMDWFENELTGDVYYARDYKKGDEHLIDGEGWKWMGENDMFGKSADDVIFSNYQTIEPEVYSGNETIGRAAYKGENAKKFMQLMGYKSVPTQVVTYDNTYSYSMSDGMHTFHFTVGMISDYTEKSSYVPNNFSESHRQQIGNSVFGALEPMTGQMPQVNRNVISYSKSPDLSGIGKFLYAIRGYHDYTTHITCGRLSPEKLTGNQGELIKKFLSKQ